MIVRKHNPLKVGIALLGAGLLLPLIVFFAPDAPQTLVGKLLDGMILGLALVLIVIGVPIMLSFPTWKQFIRRRQAALQGQSAFPLASPQPKLSEASLHLPLRITSTQHALLFAAWCVLISGAYFLVLSASRSLPKALTSGDWTDLIFPTVFSVFICGRLLLSLFKAQRIEATTEGMEVVNGTFEQSSIGGKHSIMRWDDARLFVVHRADKFWQASPKYELIGTTSAIEWNDYRQPRWWSLQRADERYTEQMEMLLAYISARTGLPLYDLR